MMHLPDIALHPTRARKLFHIFGFRGGRGRVSFGVRPMNTKRLKAHMLSHAKQIERLRIRIDEAVEGRDKGPRRRLPGRPRAGSFTRAMTRWHFQVGTLAHLIASLQEMPQPLMRRH